MSVGSMFPFDRLVRTVDQWAGSRTGQQVLAQIGAGTYEPKHLEWVRRLSPQDFQSALARSSLFIAHLGMGSLMSGIQAGVPTILMPRRKSLGEHNTDHQVDGMRWIRGRPGIWIADDEVTLSRLLDELSARSDNVKPAGISPYASEQLLGQVRSFIGRR